MKFKIITFSVLSLLMISCGSETSTDKKVEKKVAEKIEKVEKKVASVVDQKEVVQSKEISLELTANDQMQFNTDEFIVKAGQEVTLTFKHVGQIPKEGMGHNFVLLKKGVDFKTFAVAANSAKDTDYIPNGGKDIIAHTKMLGGGEEDVITFIAPAKGTYLFLCSFPGHYGIMNGEFIVE